MKKAYPLILSFFCHIFLFVLIYYVDFRDPPEIKEEPIEVKIIKKSEVKKERVKSPISSDAKAVKSSKKITTKLEMPKSRVKLSENVYKDKKDINIRGNLNFNKREFNTLEEFEESLESIKPDSSEIFIEQDNSDYSINWKGEGRERTSNTDIDFSSFPLDSFTGVGVKAIFSVNKKGEVYDVEIEAPGSGSVEFDILVKKYISEFSFTESDIISRGEVFIVYKK